MWNIKELDWAHVFRAVLWKREILKSFHTTGYFYGAHSVLLATVKMPHWTISCIPSEMPNNLLKISVFTGYKSFKRYKKMAHCGISINSFYTQIEPILVFFLPQNLKYHHDVLIISKKTLQKYTYYFGISFRLGPLTWNEKGRKEQRKKKEPVSRSDSAKVVQVEREIVYKMSCVVDNVD